MKLFIYFLFIISIFSCTKKTDKNAPKQIVLITKNAPENYKHYTKQDSLGKIFKDSTMYSFRNDNGFSYLDNQNHVQRWEPKGNSIDTLIIPYNRDYLELSTNNFFTTINETFLVKNGDTVVFEYEHKIPRAKILNREVNDTALNYNRYRLKTLFKNKYTTHSLIMNHFLLDDNSNKFIKYNENTIRYYQLALEDSEKEITLLNSLYKKKTITEIEYNYRISALKGLLEKHKNHKFIKTWLKNRVINNNETLPEIYSFDFTKTDSLMLFSFFRQHLLYNISKYNLPTIHINNGNSGAFIIDSRVRFDSILQDKRFNQTAKNLLLFDAFNGIGRDFDLIDKKKYFEKLQEEVTDREQLQKLIKDYNIDFKNSDILLLTTRKNDTITYKKVLENNKGKWLYVDIWASWCSPCRRTMPASRKLKEEFKNKNVSFIYFALNDKKAKWEEAIIKDSIQDGQHYFIENGNMSQIIEDLKIKTIPHYIIYNPKGEIVNGFAKRPGEGTNKQLNTYINKK